MRLVIPSAVYVDYLWPNKSIFSLESVLAAANKACQNLGTRLGPRKKLLEDSAVSVIKLKITSPAGAGRIVFRMVEPLGIIMPVLAVPKNDKKIGMNFAIENTDFITAYATMLRKIKKDLDEGRADIFDLDKIS